MDSNINTFYKKKMQVLKKSVNGSITVEASFVVPIILGVIVFVIITGFYMHDKCVVFGALGESSSINVMQVRNFGVSESKDIEKVFMERIKNKTINSDNIDCFGKLDSKNASIQVAFSSHFDKFPLINKLLRNSGTRNSFEVQFDISQPEENIRKTIAIKNILKERRDN